MKKALLGMLESTRFFTLQEAIWIGVGSAIVKGLWDRFPLVALYGFLAPIVAVSLGWKTWENVQERREQTARIVGPRNGDENGTGKEEDK